MRASKHITLWLVLSLTNYKKKLGRVGKDRLTGISLEEASASPTEKIPELWPRPDTGRHNPWELPAWAM